MGGTKLLGLNAPSLNGTVGLSAGAVPILMGDRFDSVLFMNGPIIPSTVLIVWTRYCRPGGGLLIQKIASLSVKKAGLRVSNSHGAPGALGRLQSSKNQFV